jgi:hypothetical protein
MKRKRIKMAKAKFGKDDYSDLLEMADAGELPDSYRIVHLLGKSKVLGEFDEFD